MKVLITGTSRGIGRACALLYLSKGHTVIGIDRNESSITDQERYTHIQADITGDLPVIDGVEILVNNAGIQGEQAGRAGSKGSADFNGCDDINSRDGCDDINGSDMIDVIDVNLKGTIAVTEKYAFTPAISSVVFMASSSASNGAEFPLYAASKGGVVAYMKNTALRLASYGATCNSISAGGVLTELNAHIIQNPDLMEQCLNETLLHKWAEAEEIAQLCYYLTKIKKSMTGQDLLIDNGEQLRSNFIW